MRLPVIAATTLMVTSTTFAAGPLTRQVRSTVGQAATSPASIVNTKTHRATTSARTRRFSWFRWPWGSGNKTLIMTRRGFTGRQWVKAPTAAKLDRIGDHNRKLSPPELQRASNKDLVNLITELDAEEYRVYRTAWFFPERAANGVQGAGDIVADEFKRRGLPFPPRMNREGRWSDEKWELRQPRFTTPGTYVEPVWRRSR